MTLVTSSRKPSPEVRKLAKEIAFALDLPYVQRGKTGLRRMDAEDSVIIFLSSAKRGGQIFALTVKGQIVFSMLITNVVTSRRTEPFHHGFVIREHELYDVLSPHFPVIFDVDALGPIVFSGTQKMQYILQVMV
ncbi:MAG: hypothetical protein LBU24_04840 [Methanocalculaceae archaeon]|jgi:U3 small nucleolar ribonucleoprotein protein IMP4|nr:hypothetical protein [Methanocalculaceae archaeon]